MKCSELKVGMILRINDTHRRGWFSNKSRRTLDTELSQKLLRFVVSPSFIVHFLQDDEKVHVLGEEDVIIYAGTKKTKTKKGRTKTFRIVYTSGNVGYIEGRDIRYLSPA